MSGSKTAQVLPHLASMLCKLFVLVAILVEQPEKQSSVCDGVSSKVSSTLVGCLRHFRSNLPSLARVLRYWEAEFSVIRLGPKKELVHVLCPDCF